MVYILGTTHRSQQSAEDVQHLVEVGSSFGPKHVIDHRSIALLCMMQWW